MEQTMVFEQDGSRHLAIENMDIENTVKESKPAATKTPKALKASKAPSVPKPGTFSLDSLRSTAKKAGSRVTEVSLPPQGSKTLGEKKSTTKRATTTAKKSTTKASTTKPKPTVTVPEPEVTKAQEEPEVKIEDTKSVKAGDSLKLDSVGLESKVQKGEHMKEDTLEAEVTPVAAASGVEEGPVQEMVLEEPAQELIIEETLASQTVEELTTQPEPVVEESPVQPDPEPEPVVETPAQPDSEPVQQMDIEAASTPAPDSIEEPTPAPASVEEFNFNVVSIEEFSRISGVSLADLSSWGVKCLANVTKMPGVIFECKDHKELRFYGMYRSEYSHTTVYAIVLGFGDTVCGVIPLKGADAVDASKPKLVAKEQRLYVDSRIITVFSARTRSAVTV